MTVNLFPMIMWSMFMELSSDFMKSFIQGNRLHYHKTTEFFVFHRIFHLPHKCSLLLSSHFSKTRFSFEGVREGIPRLVYPHKHRLSASVKQHCSLGFVSQPSFYNQRKCFLSIVSLLKLVSAILHILPRENV